jgi:hypothetical protein
MTVAKAGPQRLSGACVEGAGDGVAAKGLTVGGIAGAAPVVVGELREGGSIEQFQKVVSNASTSEVMQLVLVTQYFDTLKTIGESDKTNTLFLTHSPGAVKELSDQILQSMLIAERAKA